MRVFKTHLLSTAVVGGLAAFAALPTAALAQDEPASVAEASQAVEVERVVVTGSRLPQTEFTSASPIQVLSAEQAEAKGQADIVQFLHLTPLAAGSDQVNPAISYVNVTDGGPGAATLSLRGLGPTRTLVLINGRRAGPAGTRGAVSAVDLNTIPQAAIERVEILKDGASSIYGSDAVAGVVNLITRPGADGAEITAFYSEPFDGGGEQFSVSGDWSRTFDRGWVHASAEYFRQGELQRGERDYTNCRAQYVFDPATGQRDDVIDPRTGQPACLGLPWGQVWVYAPDATLVGRIQYDHLGDLGDYIPVGQIPFLGTPEDFYLVGYDGPSTGVLDSNHPWENEQSLIPQTERTTLFAEGAYELTGETELYGEALATRRQGKRTGYRQFWPTHYTSDVLDWLYSSSGLGGDPFSEGFTGPYGLQPTTITRHAGISEEVDYTRFVLGLRGVLPTDWSWNLFVQHSRSDGTYTLDQILNDVIDSQSFRLAPCEGQVLPVSGRTCMDINFLEPRILRGELTNEEEAFLFDVETGKTVYTQTFLEGSIAGDVFDLPAGPVGLAAGFHVRKDEIRDVPGEITLADNAWNRSGGGVTQGSENTGEFFAEAGVPLLRDAPLARRMDLTLSTRWTDTETSGSATTYKAGLDWAITPEYRLRYTWGTSFRAPALFELYLAEQSSFLASGADPCVQWAVRLNLGLITQRVADNCADPGGPGGAVPDNQPETAVLLVQEGGLGRLRPETSRAATVGFVWTPDFAPLSLAIDYFDIRIKNGVTILGEQTALACYSSDTFPTDPVCGLFERNGSSHALEQINSSYINIAEQRSRGIDLTVGYDRTLPHGLGDMSLGGQFTWQLEDERELFEGNAVDPNGEIGEPSFAGVVSASVRRGPWTADWTADLIGRQSNYASYGGDEVSIFGEPHRVKAHAEFTAFHAASLKYDGPDWSVRGGVANLFDEQPPAATTVGSGLGEYTTVGVSVLTSQYTEGYLGRRAFVRVAKRF